MSFLTFLLFHLNTLHNERVSIETLKKSKPDKMFIFNTFQIWLKINLFLKKLFGKYMNMIIK